MSRKILAIDIRSNRIAAVLLDTGIKANTVEACMTAPYNGASGEGEDLKSALERILTDLSHANATLVVNLPGNKVIFRTLSVPFKENNKIRQVLPFELEPSFPLPVDDLVIGFQKESHADQSEVLATAIARQDLDLYMALFAEHNLKPQLMLPGSFPAVLSLIDLDAQLPEHALVVDVDDDTTTLYALVTKRICLVRTIPAGIESDSQVEHLALKIRQTMTALSDSQAIEFSPTSVFLHGPALIDSAAAERFASAMAIPSHTMDLSRRMNKIEFSAGLNFDPLLYDSALASAYLAADGKACPNFHRSDSSIRNYWAAYRPYIRTPVTLLCIILVLGLGSVMYDNYHLQKQLDGIINHQEQIFRETFPDTPRSNAPAEQQMESKIKEAQKNIAAPIQASNRMRSIDALLEISQLIPQNLSVVMNRMVVSEDAITLSGVTDSFNKVDDVKGRVEKSTFFKKVTIASANMDKSGKNVRFKIKIDL